MFNTSIPLYGIMILISLIANIIVVIFMSKKNDFTKEEIFGALIYENIGIIFGAKILSYIQNYNLYEEFNFLTLGLSSYGALLGALIFLIIFALQFNKKLDVMLNTFMVPIPLMYGIGKIGCFLAGCCYGKEYSGLFRVIYKYSLSAPKDVGLFPVQLLESIVFILIFVYMINRVIKNKFTLNTLGISFILCGIAKFSLYYLRASSTSILSLNQVFSIIFIFWGIIIYKKTKTSLNN